MYASSINGLNYKRYGVFSDSDGLKPEYLCTDNFDTNQYLFLFKKCKLVAWVWIYCEIIIIQRRRSKICNLPPPATDINAIRKILSRISYNNYIRLSSCDECYKLFTVSCNQYVFAAWGSAASWF